VSLFECLLKTLADEHKQLLRQSKVIKTAYLVALSLPYLELKTDLFYESKATGTTLAYERLRFEQETGSLDFLNMLTTVDHLRNGSSSILKRHTNIDILLLSLLLGVVQGYLGTINKRAAKAYR
jgi:hypothetical protein